jgi:hypothetical protein
MLVSALLFKLAGSVVSGAAFRFELRVGMTVGFQDIRLTASQSRLTIVNHGAKRLARTFFA